MKGSFLTARDIFNHAIWKNIIDFRLFILVYGNAVFKEYNHNGTILKRGQWLRSYRSLQKDLEFIDNKKEKQYALATIKSAIKRLVNENMIEAETRKEGTLFTVLNYDKYQNFDTYRQGNPELHPEHQKAGTPNTLEQEETPVVSRFYDSEIGNPEHQKAGTPNYTPNKKNYVLKNNGLLEVEEGAKNQVSLYDEFYISYGKQPTPIQMQKLGSFLDDGMDPVCLSYAIEKASTASGHFNYLMSILSDWNRKGIRSVEQVKQAERTRGGKQSHATKKQYDNDETVEDKYKQYDFGF